MMVCEGRVIWICGFSGAGKSTFAKSLRDRFRNNGYPVVIFDADDMIDVYRAEDYKKSKDERVKWALRTSRLCDYVASQGLIVIRPTIGLIEDVLKWNRENINNYYEVFLDTPLDSLIEHDPKGLYKKGMTGEENNVFGLDLPPELPESPDFQVDFRNAIEPDTIVEKVYVENTIGR